MTPTPMSDPLADRDLTDRLHADAPVGSRPPAFDAADVAYAVHDTPVGRILLACNDSGALVGLMYAVDTAAEDAALTRLATGVSPRILRLPGRLDQARRQVDDYLDGGRHTFDLRWELTLAGEFQRDVLQTLARRVGYGQRAGYGELAGWVGRPKAARAVGAALGANPLCLVLPCHRVVAASGALTGYAGGLAAKRLLLELETAGAR